MSISGSSERTLGWNTGPDYVGIVGMVNANRNKREIKENRRRVSIGCK